MQSPTPRPSLALRHHPHWRATVVRKDLRGDVPLTAPMPVGEAVREYSRWRKRGRVKSQENIYET